MFNYNGVYNFQSAIDRLIDDNEREYIIEILKNTDLNFSEEDTCIGLMYETRSTAGIARHLLNHVVIIKAARSENPKDILAVAIAMSREGAYYRPRAIQRYETFFESPCKLPLMPEETFRFFFKDDPYQSRAIFNDWDLHMDLRQLYEKEYQFEKALSEVQICLKFFPDDVDLATGEILMKIDMNRAKEYYDDLLLSEKYENHKETIDHVRSEFYKKWESGYVYKPRKNKKPPQLSDHQLLALGAAPCLI